jgi:SAM-dependent methyltransferase
VDAEDELPDDDPANGDDETDLSANERTFPLEVGTTEHYLDAQLYDFEYRRRRVDVNFYRGVASEVGREFIVELGCGTGRLLVPLLRDGRRVLGVDRSSTMLAAAAARVARTGRRAANGVLVRADFRSVGLAPAAKLVLCPFNTLQHVYTRDDLEQFLARVRGALASDGRFVFDVMNPDLDWLARDRARRWARTKFRHPKTGARLAYSTNHTYDRATQINHISIYYENLDAGGEEEVRLTHRMYFPAELEGLLHYNGFRLLDRYGDFGYGPLESDSEQQVCVTCAR